MAGTLYDLLWDAHVVATDADGQTLLYVDRQLLHEVSSPQAFAGLRAAGLAPRRPATHLAVADHAVPTHDRDRPIADPLAREQVALLEANCAATGIDYLALAGRDQGIVHVVGPEQGFTLPGITLVCGDSHSATHGAFGALAFGIGASECETVLATQSLWQQRSATMRVTFAGALPPGLTAKDMILAMIGRIGVGGAAGHAIEYAGAAVTALSMEARMTLCNMSIEAGSRTGLIAPDATTFAYLKGRRRGPAGADWDRAVAAWRGLASAPDATFDRELTIDLADLAPQVSFGTSPDQVLPIDGRVPDPAACADAGARGRLSRALDYMGLAPGTAMTDIAVDHVFIGSCTNGRIEDLRAAAGIVGDGRVAPGVTALVVPGSGAVKRQAEAEGLDRIFTAAGFQWREAGCSLCVAMNDDRLPPGARCASTSNRNFEGRQGVGAHPSGQPGDGGGGGAGRPLRRCAGPLRVEPFGNLTGRAASLPQDNVDTDIIFPARFLVITEKRGLGRHAFRDRADLSVPADAAILVTGDNFGCGSSREQAPWALADLGIRAIVAPGFGEIFRSNCFKNGILPIVLPAAQVDRMHAAARAGEPFTVDLDAQEIRLPATGALAFTIEPARREALLRGLDEIARIRALFSPMLATFEARRRGTSPWLWTHHDG